MKIRMIAPIRHFTMDLEEIALTKDLKIIDGALLTSQIQVSKKFKEQIGLVNWDLITRHHIFYFEGEASDLVELKSAQKLTVIKTIHKKLGDFFYGFIDGLWFIKDNCCFCNQFFLELLTDKVVSITYKDVLISTATDEFSYFNFDAGEIERHKTIFFTIKKFQVLSDAKHQTAIDQLLSAEGGIIASPTNTVIYDHPRLYRALFFLDMVRKHGSAITKITFFMSLYECLFTSDDHAIAKKIRERASSLLGGTTKERKIFKDLIFRAYEIRSRNVHGDVIETPPEKIKKIVSDLDDYTRKILITIINLENNEVFTLPDSAHTKEVFESYFDKLVRLTVKAETFQGPENQLGPCVVKFFLPR